MAVEINNPLSDPCPPEVPLSNAPLVRVIAQVRFSPILRVQDQDFIAPFQEAIRMTYPMLRWERTYSLIVGQQGAAAGNQQGVWRFTDAKDVWQWRVSLAPDFVALETTEYTSRREFIDRIKFVLGAVETHLNPGVVQRIGLRYIDRVTGDALNEIKDLVRPEMLGIVNTPLGRDVHMAISETLFNVPADKDRKLMARWGWLPANTAVDPNAIEAIGEKSWILDIDMFQTGNQKFDAMQLTGELEDFAKRLYAVFRWSVTDEFLRRYGGRV